MATVVPVISAAVDLCQRDGSSMPSKRAPQSTGAVWAMQSGIYLGGSGALHAITAVRTSTARRLENLPPVNRKRRPGQASTGSANTREPRPKRPRISKKWLANGIAVDAAHEAWNCSNCRRCRKDSNSFPIRKNCHRRPLRERPLSIGSMSGTRMSCIDRSQADAFEEAEPLLALRMRWPRPIPDRVRRATVEL